MSSGRSVGKKSKKIASNSKPNGVSLQDKLKMVDKEEQTLLKDLDHLKKWTDAIDGMNDEQLKEYLENRPQELKSVKIQKNKPKQKVQKAVKTKASKCSGIMASVWKFHKEEDDDGDDDDDDDKVNKGIKQSFQVAQ